MDFAAGKTRLIAWFVNNKNAKNARLQYAFELAKHIEVLKAVHCLNNNFINKLTFNVLK